MRIYGSYTYNERSLKNTDSGQNYFLVKHVLKIVAEDDIRRHYNQIVFT